MLFFWYHRQYYTRRPTRQTYYDQRMSAPAAADSPRIRKNLIINKKTKEIRDFNTDYFDD